MTKNFVELIGFVGQDPPRIGSGDTSPVKVSLATTERWNDDSGERQERTEWHTVLFWNRLAEVAAKYIKKGSHVLVTGSLKSRQYEDDEAQRHTVWEIHTRELLLLDSKTSGVEDADEAATQQEATIAPAGGQTSQGNSAGNSRPRTAGSQSHQNHGRRG
jgi:single-strand DNA-binding protein